MRHKALIAGMLAVATAFCMVLTLGYPIRERYPAIPDRVFGAIAGVALTGIVVGVMRLILGSRSGRGGLTRGERRKLRKDADRQYAAFLERSRLRIAELIADPAKRKVCRVSRAWRGMVR